VYCYRNLIVTNGSVGVSKEIRRYSVWVNLSKCTWGAGEKLPYVCLMMMRILVTCVANVIMRIDLTWILFA